MSLLVPCSACKSRDRGKNAWLVWAWNLADGERVAYKQRLCLQCAIENVSVLLVNIMDAPLSCPACHTDAGDAMDPTYLTYVFPGSGKEQAEMATCGPCAVEIRNRATRGADKLPDRLQGVGAAAPTDAGTSGWDAIGLRRLAD